MHTVMKYEITFEQKPSDEDRSRIGKGIEQHGITLFPDTKVTDVTFFLRDEAGAIVGGVAGNHGSFGWLYVDALWVADDLRGHGYGKRLMGMIEAEAVRHSCTNVYLNTFSFQAPAFYKKLGYTVFAEL